MKSEHLFLVKTSWGSRKGLMQAHLIGNLKKELQEDGIWLLKTHCLLFAGKRYYTESQANILLLIFPAYPMRKKFSVLLSLMEEWCKISSYFLFWPVKAQSSSCVNFKAGIINKNKFYGKHMHWSGKDSGIKPLSLNSRHMPFSVWKPFSVSLGLFFSPSCFLVQETLPCSC